MNYPDGAEIARRFVKYAPGRSDRFEDGVRNPTKDWKTETAAAEDNYEEGVKKGIGRKAFGKGVVRCGTDRQKSQTIKNLNRWAEGIEGAEDVMTTAMDRVASVAKAINLPKRYPKGDDRNYARSKAVGVALRKAKEEGKF
ncbi:hypothetical protein ES707_14230 [subsurface metagenome]